MDSSEYEQILEKWSQRIARLMWIAAVPLMLYSYFGNWPLKGSHYFINHILSHHNPEQASGYGHFVLITSGSAAYAVCLILPSHLLISCGEEIADRKLEVERWLASMALFGASLVVLIYAGVTMADKGWEVKLVWLFGAFGFVAIADDFHNRRSENRFFSYVSGVAGLTGLAFLALAAFW